MSDVYSKAKLQEFKDYCELVINQNGLNLNQVQYFKNKLCELVNTLETYFPNINVLRLNYYGIYVVIIKLSVTLPLLLLKMKL